MGERRMQTSTPGGTSGDQPLENREQDLVTQASQLVSAGHLQQASDLCRKLLNAEPLNASAMRLQGIIAGQQGRLLEGLRLVERALGLEPRNSGFHFTRGQLLMRMGKPMAAAEAYKLSAHLNTSDPLIPRHWVLALIACKRLSEAEAVANAALLQFPAAAELLDAAGLVYKAQGRYSQASEILERARALAPAYPDTWGTLAILYEESNRLDMALEVIGEGLQRWPMQQTLRFIRARCLRRRGMYAEAKSALLELLNSDAIEKLRKDIEYELGWCEDGLGNAVQAYDYFSQANLHAEQLPGYEPGPGVVFSQTIEALQNQFKPDWVRTWHHLPSTDPGHDPVFIIGFPRSGTTLLDTMLGAHADIKVLEESATIQAILQRLHRYAGGYPAGLASLIPEQLAELRRAYYLAAGPDGDSAGDRILVDKSPFNTVHAGLIHRVFPGSLLIFMVRHPCDVCLSCFMNNFELNSGTGYFTRLETSISLYCKVMALWLTYVELLRPNYRLVRYENLVTQPEYELRRLLKDLGVDWSDDVLQHAGHALRRGHIPTPSYAQVSHPIYTDACNRWRRYAEMLRPHLRELQPYIEAFGYAV